MNLQNDYKVIYEVITEGKRTFYASKDANCVPTGDEKLVEDATIGAYKLVYEKNGRIYGSVSGVPAEGDYCFEGFDKVFKVAAATPATTSVEEPVAPVVELPTEPEMPVEDPQDAE